jgi:hypothetical protein
MRIVGARRSRPGACGCVGDLADLDGQLGLVVAESETQDFKDSLLAFGRAELLWLSGEFDGSVKARLDRCLASRFAFGSVKP